MNSNDYVDFLPLLTVKEVAVLLIMSKSKVYSMTRLGELTSVRIKGNVRVRPEDLKKFIADNLLNNCCNESFTQRSDLFNDPEI